MRSAETRRFFGSPQGKRPALTAPLDVLRKSLKSDGFAVKFHRTRSVSAVSFQQFHSIQQVRANKEPRKDVNKQEFGAMLGSQAGESSCWGSDRNGDSDLVCEPDGRASDLFGGGCNLHQHEETEVAVFLAVNQFRRDFDFVALGSLPSFWGEFPESAFMDVARSGFLDSFSVAPLPRSRSK